MMRCPCLQITGGKNMAEKCRRDCYYDVRLDSRTSRSGSTWTCQSERERQVASRTTGQTGRGLGGIAQYGPRVNRDLVKSREAPSVQVLWASGVAVDDTSKGCRMRLIDTPKLFYILNFVAKACIPGNRQRASRQGSLWS